MPLIELVKRKLPLNLIFFKKGGSRPMVVATCASRLLHKMVSVPSFLPQVLYNYIAANGRRVNSAYYSSVKSSLSCRSLVRYGVKNIPFCLINC